MGEAAPMSSRRTTSLTTIRYEVADRVATITFDRPDQLNALSPVVVRELRQAYADAVARTATSGSTAGSTTCSR
jgi:enoyl-CoA hydratase/carnithine racemase